MNAFDARLLPGTEEDIRNPVFSPDGLSVAYVARSGSSGSQLKRLALSGGAPVVVCPASNPFGISWETDGTILFGQAAGIMRVSANGGTPDLVVPASDGEVLADPQLLPDGDTVLLSVGGGVFGGAGWDAAQVAVQSMTSGERQVLVEGGSAARYVPTGHLVYVLGDGLFALPFDAESLSVSGGPVSMIEGIVRARGAASGNYSVSDNGTLFHLAGSAGVGDSPLVWVDRDGGFEVIDTIPPNAYLSPRLSSDGARVLVVADGDAWVYDLASGRESRLTTDGETAVYAGWTPSGDAVTYTSGRGAVGTLNVWTQPADGSGSAQQLTALDGSVHFDSWAPDGRTFSAHHHGTGPSNQLMVSVDSAAESSEAWLEREFNDSNAVFSPDGRYVAHISGQSGENEIYIRPFPGPGGQTPVSVGGGTEPAWAANGELFYRRPGDYAMMVVQVSADPVLTVSPPVELFARGAAVGGGGGRARWTVTADGQRFLGMADVLASRGDETQVGSGPRVNIVLDWVQELSERVPVP